MKHLATTLVTAILVITILSVVFLAFAVKNNDLGHGHATPSKQLDHSINQPESH